MPNAVAAPTYILRNELLGATHASFVVLPLCLAYGLLAFAPLGTHWAVQGVMAGIIAAVVTPILAAAFGLRSGLVFAPRPISAVVMASFLAEFSTTPEVRASGPQLIVLGMLLYVVFVGAIELVFGIARIGRLAKYLPAPVVAGFQCGAALVLLQTQWGVLLGIEGRASVAAVFAGEQVIRPTTLAVAAVCVTAAIVASRKTARWPVFAWVLIVAAAAQWLFMQLGVTPAAPLGKFDLAAFDPMRILRAVQTLPYASVEPHLPLIASWALTGAVMSAAGTLVGFKMIEEATQHKMDVDRELVRAGVANVVAAGVGALHAGAHVRSTEVNLKQGAQTGLSTVATALLVAALATLLAPVIALIPKAAIAAILVVIAVSMFDAWTLQVLRQAIAERVKPAPDVVSMLATVAIVSGLAVATNLLIAMLAGVVLAVVSFIWRMSRSIIRRTYSLRDVQSRTIRSADARGVLLSHGSRVKVLELEGPLFFGTGEKLTDVLAALHPDETLVAIVDMQRVSDIDSTAVRLLAQVDKRLEKNGILLLISGVPLNGRIYRLLEDFGMNLVVPHGEVFHTRVFTDVDQGLEWAEELLLEADSGSTAATAKYGLETLDMLRSFRPEERETIARYLITRKYADGDTVFAAGDISRELFAIAEGRASVTLPGAAGGAPTRLVTFSAGAVFGEFALLDNQPRSATVRADSDLECWVLTAEAFDALKSREPACAIKLLANLGRELSTRLRTANQTIRVLAP